MTLAGVLGEVAVGALLLAAAFNTSLSAWLFTRRVRTAARPLAVMTLATAIWQVTYALELLGGSDGTSTDWVKYQHIGIAVLPVAWFVFAVRYVGASRLLGRSTRALLLALPVVHLALAFTNDWHRLVWRNWTLVHQPFPIHRAEYGAWFWGFAASSHLLILGGIVLLAWPRVGARGLYARQGRFLAAVALAPWLANAAYLFRLGPVPGLDLTPFGFTLASAVFALNVVPLRLLDLVPIARSAVVEGMSDGVVVIDDQGRVVDINPAAARLLGVDAVAVVGRDACDGLGAWKGLPAAAGTGRTAELSVGSGESSRTLEQRVSLIRDSRDRVTGSLVVLVDVTVRKRWEAQLETTNQRLAAALEQSEGLTVEAQAASRAKAAFAANVSHEMRTPLHGIIGSSELLLGGELRGEERELVELIHRSGIDLLAVVSDVLDFSKLDSRRVALERRVVDIRELVEDRLEKVALVARGKDLGLDYEIAEGVPDGVLADRARVGQVLDILLSNAVKFTQAGRVKVSVEVDCGDTASPRLRFGVSDTGIGLAPEAWPLLFEPFMQADSTTTRRFRGAGLGLSIARRLCELMGGEIRAAESDRGARFLFSLPLAEAALPRAVYRERSQARCAGRRVWIEHPRAGLRTHLARAARFWGMEVVDSPARDAGSVAPRSGDALLVDDRIADETTARLNGAGHEPRVIAVRPLGQDRRCRSAHGDVSDPVRWARLYDALVVVGEPADAASRPRPAVMPGPGATRPRVLIVEDNSVIRDVLVAQFTSLGADVGEAENGLHAVRAASREPYDLLLMDVQMPELDGLDATRQIRTLRLSPRPWIVALTASATEEDRRRCVEAGMDAFYAKPAHLGALRHMLDLTPLGPDAADAAEPVDWNILRELEVADPANLIAIGDEFSRGTAPLVDALDEAQRAHDTRGLAAAARLLARFGTDIGARRLARLCDRIRQGISEDGALELVVDDIRTELDRVGLAFQRARRRDYPAR